MILSNDVPREIAFPVSRCTWLSNIRPRGIAEMNPRGARRHAICNWSLLIVIQGPMSDACLSDDQATIYLSTVYSPEATCLKLCEVRYATVLY